MLQVTCIGTGSEGNSYIVWGKESAFLLDAGVNLERVINHININYLDFAFISHEHQDHSKEAKKLSKKGVSVVYGKSVQCFQEFQINSKISSVWQILAFPIKHGDCKNAGCIIRNRKTKETLLYLTDFTLIEYDLSCFKFDTVIIECNYIQEIVDKDPNSYRVLENIKRHCELKYTMQILDSLKTKEIILCHMSESYGDSIAMATTIYNRYKVPTGICKKHGGIDWYGKETIEQWLE